MRLTVSLCALLVVACAPQAPSVSRNQAERALVDGQLEVAGNIGATVSLFGCTGTLIAPRVVLTAAHCIYVYPEDPDEVPTTLLDPADVIVAHSTLNNETAAFGDLIVAEEILVHPEWDWEEEAVGSTHDIALVILSVEAPITPAPILEDDDVDVMLVEGAPLFLQGYGLSDPYGEAFGVLHSGETSFVSRTGPEFVAAGGANNCLGDSGGPAYVVVEGVPHLVGVVSREHDLTRPLCQGGTVYGFVNASLPWIEDVTRDLVVAPEPAPAPEQPEPEPEYETGAIEVQAQLSGCAQTRGSDVLWCLALLLVLVTRSGSTRRASGS